VTEPARASGRRIVVVLVTGFVLLVLAGFVASWQVDRVRRRKIDEDEAAAMKWLDALATEQERFRAADRDGDGALEYAATIAELAFPAERDGYVFEVRPGDPITSRWVAWARPEAPGLTGERFFYIDETRALRAERGVEPGPTSPVVPR
jgi:hypothetical protein